MSPANFKFLKMFKIKNFIKNRAKIVEGFKPSIEQDEWICDMSCDISRRQWATFDGYRSKEHATWPTGPMCQSLPSGTGFLLICPGQSAINICISFNLSLKKSLFKKVNHFKFISFYVVHGLREIFTVNASRPYISVETHRKV